MTQSAPDPGADPEAASDRPDYRLAGPAVAAWLTAAGCVGIDPVISVAAGLLLVVLAGLGARRRRHATALLLAAVAAAAVVSGLRVAATTAGPVAVLAQQHAVADVVLTLRSDPVVRPGRFEDFVVAEARIERITGRGQSARVDSPVLVIADLAWSRLPLGARVDAVGRLSPATGTDVSAVFLPSRIEAVVAGPAWWWRASSVMREGVAEGVATTGTDARALVPALVDGDDSGVPADLAADFRTSGLTHLLAVSGTNLTLVVGFLLLVGRWCGVRGYAAIAVGLLGTAAFVLLARPEPSVLRAAAMGLVALAGLGAGGRRRGVRALSLAVLVLVLIDPWLSRSIGFVLSVVATAGILVLSPRWSAALSRWLPTPLADALAVPMAAQVACTPVVAAFSGQVSIVAVGANLLAGPAVGPATVLGLLAGALALLWDAAGHLVGHAAAAMVWWIATVARHGARLPGASTEWDSGAVGIAVLVVICVAICLVAPRALARPRTSMVCLALAAAWVLHPVSWGWPPRGWVMVACDVGQGDALVLAAGEGTAVVVDTGPDPALMDECLDRLDVTSIPLVVLTHLHADHVDGLPGVFDGRAVGSVDIGPVVPDTVQYADVLAIAAAHGVPVTHATYATAQSIGPLKWTVLGPVPGVATPEVSGTAQNNSSVVLAVATQGIRLLLTGDVEPEAQQALLAWGPALHADVLKVPHHGSAHQDVRFLEAVGADVAVISVGADNDYGHPSVQAIAPLERNGVRVLRTDRDGDIAVVVADDQLSVVTR